MELLSLTSQETQGEGGLISAQKARQLQAANNNPKGGLAV